MQIFEQRTDGVITLRLDGRLDASTSQDFKARVTDLVQAGFVNIVMDMSGVDFIDSSGIGALVAALRAATALGGAIKIAALQSPVRSIFELTRMHRIFEIFGDSAAAAASFAN